MTVIIRDRFHMYPTKFKCSKQREEAGHKAVEIAVPQKDYTSSWEVCTSTGTLMRDYVIGDLGKECIYIKLNNDIKPFLRGRLFPLSKADIIP